jgi:monoamine oxidase
LSPLKQQLTQRMPHGSIIKCHLRYQRPFWRDNGFAGIVFSDQGPACYSYDNCSADGTYCGLMSFIYSDVSTRMRRASKDERRRMLCAQYAEMFDTEEAFELVDYVEYDWNADPFSGGCYTGTLPPGVLTSLGDQLRATSGNDRIHYAGTETAYHWTGYQDGAVEAGERAAHAVLQQQDIITEDFKINEPVDFESEVVCSPAELDWWMYYLPRPSSLFAATTVTALAAMGYRWRR